MMSSSMINWSNTGAVSIETVPEPPTKESYPTLGLFHLVAKGGFCGATVNSMTQGVARTEYAVLGGSVAKLEWRQQGVGSAGS